MDPEIKAMADVTTALDGLEPDAMRRVLSWANQRFQVKPVYTSLASEPTQTPAPDLSLPSYGEFHELFDAANPSTSVEKVLVTAYWFQINQKNEDLDSMELNRALKNLGHPSTNITRDLDALINRTPRMVMQVSKGPTKSARKRYKLTREGLRAVERMVLASPANGTAAH